MTNEQPVVLLEHAQKSFGGTPVLKDISLKVQPGEVVAVIGPSGGGKSTLLRCMTLLETLDAGRLAYGDLVVAESDGAGAAAYAPKAVLKEAKTRFGLVFQNFNLFPHYSVLKNITDAPLHVQKRPKDEVLAAACWRRWAWKARRTWCPASCRAASSNAWPSPARSRSTPTCCSSTSPRARSTQS